MGPGRASPPGWACPAFPATAARPPRPSWAGWARSPWTRPATSSSLDTDNNRVRVVAARSGRFYGQAMTARDIYTVAGDGSAGDMRRRRPGHQGRARASRTAVAVDRAGNLVIADTDTQPGAGWWPATTGTVLRPGHDGRRHLHRGRATAAADSPATAARPRGAELDVAQAAWPWTAPGTCCISRQRQQPDPGGGGHDPARSTARSMTAGDIYTVAGHRHRRVLRRRRPGHPGRARPARTAWPSTPDGQPGHRRRGQQPGAGGGGQSRARSTARP